MAVIPRIEQYQHKVCSSSNWCRSALLTRSTTYPQVEQESAHVVRIDLIRQISKAVRVRVIGRVNTIQKHDCNHHQDPTKNICRLVQPTCFFKPHFFPFRFNLQQYSISTQLISTCLRLRLRLMTKLWDLHSAKAGYVPERSSGIIVTKEKAPSYWMRLLLWQSRQFRGGTISVANWSGGSLVWDRYSMISRTLVLSCAIITFQVLLEVQILQH